jgi:tetraacyldisaccharide 4'-kinase
VGNITSGGAGKTPVAVALAKILLESGLKVAFVSRGYGGGYQKVLQVDPSLHDAKMVGDEPLILSKVAPTFVAKNKAEAISLAVANQAEIVIMDDGLQNNSVYKDCSILVIDGAYGLGNSYLLPAGPLRESLSSALKRANFVIIIGEDQTDVTAQIKGQVPVFTAKVQPIFTPLAQKKYYAFAGIAHPQKFFATLSNLNLSLAGTKDFPDHYYYSEFDLENLVKSARALGATLITTEKDATRISPKYLKEMVILPIELTFTKNDIQQELFKAIGKEYGTAS